MDQVHADGQPEITTDGAWGRLGGVGCPYHLPHRRHRARPLQHERDQGARSDEIGEVGEERLVQVFGVVLTSHLHVHLHQLQAVNTQSFPLKARDDLADKPALDTVGLDQDQGSLAQLTAPCRFGRGTIPRAHPAGARVTGGTLASGPGPVRPLQTAAKLASVSEHSWSQAGRRMTIVVDASPLRDSRRHAGIGRYTASMVAALSKHEEIALHAVMPLLPPVFDTLALRWLNAQPGLALARPFHAGALLHGMASEASQVWPPERQVVTIHHVIPWTMDIPMPPTTRPSASQRRRLPRCAAIVAGSPTRAKGAT